MGHSTSEIEDSEHPDPQAPDPADLQCRVAWKRLVLKIILAVLTAPYRRAFKLYTWKPIKDFRRADGDRRMLIPLVRDWKVDKYAELQSVQVAASFCAGATLATISWTGIPNPIWVSDALWFSALICAIWAVITSIQVRSILDDVPDREQLTQRLPDCELLRMRRVILRYKKSPGLGHWIMLFIWQFPSMTMSYAWCTFLAGLTIYVCTPFINADKWSDHHKIAIVYLVVCSIGCITYVFSSIFVYTSEKAFLQSAGNTRHNTDTTPEPEAATPFQSRVSSKVSMAGRPPYSSTTDMQQLGLGLDSIPEDVSDSVRRAQTLPLPEGFAQRDALLMKRRFLI